MISAICRDVLDRLIAAVPRTWWPGSWLRRGALDRVPSIAFRVSTHVLTRVGTPANRIVATAIAVFVRSAHSSPDGHTCGPKKISSRHLVMTHARHVRVVARTSIPSQPFSMPNALFLPFLATVFRPPPPLPAFPLGPPPRLLPTFLAAVARHRLPRSEALFASLQQTRPSPRRP